MSVHHPGLQGALVYGSMWLIFYLAFTLHVRSVTLGSPEETPPCTPPVLPPVFLRSFTKPRPSHILLDAWPVDDLLNVVPLIVSIGQTRPTTSWPPLAQTDREPQPKKPWQKEQLEVRGAHYPLTWGLNTTPL